MRNNQQPDGLEAGEGVNVTEGLKYTQITTYHLCEVHSNPVKDHKCTINGHITEKIEQSFCSLWVS